MPCTGIEPATPTTMMAHGRNEINASEQELIDCPAPESMYNEMTLPGVGEQGRPRQVADAVLAAAARTLLILDGLRSAGILSGYTTIFVSAL